MSGSGQHTPASTAGPPAGKGALAWMRANRSFVTAATILLAASISWNLAMGMLGWTMVKYPVPARAAETNAYRLVNFPTRIGKYRLAQDGEVDRDRQTGRPIFDKEPDGLIEMPSEQLEELGTTKNKQNWYYMSIFRDTSRSAGDSRAYIQLNVTYYTGLLDAVPHVADYCIAASGGRVDPKLSGTILASLPAGEVPEAWREITLYRTAYTGRRGERSAQYHVFSMNGEPTAHWLKVRYGLIKPWVRYCYFAKIQLAPSKPGLSIEESDGVCRDFARAALPEVLKLLPTVADVEKLAASGGS